MKRFVITGTDVDQSRKAFEDTVSSIITTYGQEQVYDIHNMQTYVSDHWQCDLMKRLGRNGHEKTPTNIASFALKIFEEAEANIPENKQIVIYSTGAPDLASVFEESKMKIPRSLISRVREPYNQIFVVRDVSKDGFDTELYQLYSKKEVTHVTPDRTNLIPMMIFNAVQYD